jgi:hypothetical protein
MAEIRSLKLALLADTKQFIEGLDKADKETRSFSNKLGDALKKGALAFAAVGAAAGAMAIKIGVDAVKAAIEDQQSQKQLAEALKNTTKATDAQVKATEEYITKAQNATGVTDTKLRAALGNLLRATNDVTKAQKLNNLALDISAATGNDLEAVSLALSKAYNGNLGALTRLGIPLDDNIIKTKDFDAATKVLAETFGGAAAANAETFAGKMEIIKRRLEDAQETIGYAILPILERFSSFINEEVVPAIEGLVDGLTGKQKSVVPAFLTFGETLESSEDAGYKLGEALRNLAKGLGTVGDDFETETGEGSGLVKFINLLTDVVELVDNLADKINAVLGPFSRLLEFSQRFAETESQRRIEPRLIPQTINPDSIFKKTAPQILISNNFNGGFIDPQKAARDIIKVTNTALSTTGISFIRPQFR